MEPDWGGVNGGQIDPGRGGGVLRKRLEGYRWKQGRVVVSPRLYRFSQFSVHLTTKVFVCNN